MVSVLTPPGPIETLADLLRQLGGISPERVRFRPLPGTATERDVLDVQTREGRLCELVDGVLVEKGIGFRESFLAMALTSAPLSISRLTIFVCPCRAAQCSASA